jgi:hypothetical protein
MRHGANPTIPNADRLTAFDLARKVCRKEASRARMMDALGFTQLSMRLRQPRIMFSSRAESAKSGI